MNQYIFEPMSEFYAYLLRIRLSEPEQDRLLALFLSVFPEKETEKICSAAEKIRTWDARTLSDELFKATQYRMTNETLKAVIRAKVAAISANGGSDALPPIESRAALLRPEILGAKYDKALLDYARGEKALAESELAELFRKYYCISAGEKLVYLYHLDGSRDKLADCTEKLTKILSEKMLMDQPEWLSHISEAAGIQACPEAEVAERAWLKSFVPFDPKAPSAEKERIGFV